jgi:hypothetical protein
MNPWQVLQGMLLQDAVSIARVLGENADGQMIVEAVDTAQKSLISGVALAPGKLVYVQSGKVVSEAPVLARYRMEV